MQKKSFFQSLNLGIFNFSNYMYYSRKTIVRYMDVIRQMVLISSSSSSIKNDFLSKLSDVFVALKLRPEFNFLQIMVVWFEEEVFYFGFCCPQNIYFILAFFVDKTSKPV